MFPMMFLSHLWTSNGSFHSNGVSYGVNFSTISGTKGLDYDSFGRISYCSETDTLGVISQRASIYASVGSFYSTGNVEVSS